MELVNVWNTVLAKKNKINGNEMTQRLMNDSPPTAIRRITRHCSKKKEKIVDHRRAPKLNTCPIKGKKMYKMLPPLANRKKPLSRQCLQEQKIAQSLRSPISQILSHDLATYTYEHFTLMVTLQNQHGSFSSHAFYVGT
jgi:hypothetical protein